MEQGCARNRLTYRIAKCNFLLHNLCLCGGEEQETSSAHGLSKSKAATAMLSEVVSASYISLAKVLFYTTMLMQECGDTDTAHSLSSPVQTPTDNSDAVYLQPASERCAKRQFYSVGMAQQLMKLSVSGQTH